MKYYIYTCDSDTYHSLTILPPSSAKDLYKVTGPPLKNRWKPLAVDYDRTVTAGDFPRLTGHVPVFDQKALNVLRPLVESCAEILPLVGKAPDMPLLFALNVRSIDCLDPERAEITALPDGKPIFVAKYAFRKDVLGDTPLFRIQHLELSNCFVSEAFRAAVEKASLQGLIFKAL
jgi:hypothetical protein